MGSPSHLSPEQWYARLYDARGIGWVGELELYRRLASAEGCVGPDGRGVLEVACGTGRVALDLAARGSRVSGVDLSADMIEIARAKSHGDNPTWCVGDMRSFDVGERFGLVLIPGHSFQFMLSADDQVATLRRIHDHCLPDGLLCVHIDHPEIDWLGSLPTVPGEQERDQPIIDPVSGERYRLARSWTYERATQTATAYLTWEQLEPGDDVIARIQMPPMPQHVVGRTEMEHALRRSGFTIEALYGDFNHGPFVGSSSEMIWLGRRE
jgi:SAM-dependent methyltransferase